VAIISFSQEFLKVVDHIPSEKAVPFMASLARIHHAMKYLTIASSNHNIMEFMQMMSLCIGKQNIKDKGKI